MRSTVATRKGGRYTRDAARHLRAPALTGKLKGMIAGWTLSFRGLRRPAIALLFRCQRRFTPMSMFPTTDWGLFAGIRQVDTPARSLALDALVRRYWRPVFLFIRQHSFGVADAEDLTQEFFALWLAKDNFAKPDSAKGRFRDLLQASLRRFISNVVRTRQAKRRMPTHGFVSIQELAEAEGPIIEPYHEETPEALFNRAWAVTLVTRVLRQLEREAVETGKAVHYDILKQRIVHPLLDGSEPPTMRELAARHRIDEKQAANALLTARRAYQRLLRDEIRLYARSEDEVSAEVREVFRALQKSNQPMQTSAIDRVLRG
jgi:DNA-directed RNA polymerase specialized sigma24 family protein